MVFNSYIFILLFAPLVVTGYFLINYVSHGKSSQYSMVWLLVASFVFYAYNLPEFVAFLIIDIIVNYGIGKAIVSLKRTVPKQEWLQKIVVACGITVNLLPLLYYKYSNFILEILESFGGEQRELEIALPLGISFITFQQIAYLLDCYKEESRFEKSFLYYASYVAFFPKIAMGPIALSSEIIPQFKDSSKKRINYHNLSMGLYAFALGLAKKVLLADVLAKVVNVGFLNIDEQNTGSTIIIMLCYTLQLYFDFSGYCDMASGISKMINIELPINFNSPYKAKSITEFWDRWHITLTRFFTRYVYIPLGGSRKGTVRTYINIILIFLLSGIWHGSAWNFVFWGLLHGTCMVLERIMRELKTGRKRIVDTEKNIISVLKWIGCFIVINITWVFFRAKSVEDAVLILRNIFKGGWNLNESLVEVVYELIEIRLLNRIGFAQILSYLGDGFIWGILLVLVFAVTFMKNTQEKMQSDRYTWKRSIYAVMLIVWSVISLSDVSEFLYFNF